jgi:Leucine-rich repeat (LRR) protein
MATCARLTSPPRRGHNAVMSQPSKKPKPRRRWFQFSLRTLLAVMTLAAGLAVAWRIYVEPYRQQRQTMKLIEHLGGSYQTVAAPGWLRTLFGQDFQNITLVNLADCDTPAAYLGQVAALPALETLVVGGQEFTDEHLRPLHRVSTLRGLVLDSTDVTVAAIDALRKSLPHVDVYQSQRRTIAELKTQRVILDGDWNASHPRLQQLLGKEWFFEPVHAQLFHIPKDSDVALLARLPQLRALELTGLQLVDDDLVPLRRLGQLQELYVTQTHITDAGLAHLDAFPQLKKIALNDTHVSSAGLAHLARLTELEELELGTTKVDDEGLVHVKQLSKLRRLSLFNTRVTDAGMTHLKEMTQLRELNLVLTQVSDAGLAHLTGLTQLEVLFLGEQITDEGLIALEGLTQLRRLGLGSNKITDAGLLRLTNLRQLRELSLGGNRVGDAGLDVLKQLADLERIDLDGSAVTDHGLRHLSSLKSLRVLGLRRTSVSDIGLVHLKKLSKLENLWLEMTKVTATGVDDLRQALPKCQISASTLPTPAPPAPPDSR